MLAKTYAMLFFCFFGWFAKAFFHFLWLKFLHKKSSYWNLKYKDMYLG